MNRLAYNESMITRLKRDEWEKENYSNEKDTALIRRVDVQKVLLLFLYSDSFYYWQNYPLWIQLPNHYNCIHTLHNCTLIHYVVYFDSLCIDTMSYVLVYINKANDGFNCEISYWHVYQDTLLTVHLSRRYNLSPNSTCAWDISCSMFK